jgi:predicted phosphodiesterase
MLRLVVLSDVHGNRWALDAVLAEVERDPPDVYLVLGDLAADGPDPVGTLARLRALPNATFVRGNTDRYLGDLVAVEAHSGVEDPGGEWADLIATWQWAAEALGAEKCRFLANLPADVWLDTPAGPVLATHGLPGHDERGIEPNDVETLEKLEWRDARLLLAGHSHVPFVLQGERGTAINPGSVGLSPQTQWRASYARMDFYPGGQVAVQHAQVAWDVAAYLAAFGEGIPLNRRAASMLDAMRRRV